MKNPPRYFAKPHHDGQYAVVRIPWTGTARLMARYAAKADADALVALLNAQAEREVWH